MLLLPVLMLINIDSIVGRTLFKNKQTEMPSLYCIVASNTPDQIIRARYYIIFTSSITFFNFGHINFSRLLDKSKMCMLHMLVLGQSVYPKNLDRNLNYAEKVTNHCQG